MIERPAWAIQIIFIPFMDQALRRYIGKAVCLQVSAVVRDYHNLFGFTAFTVYHGVEHVDGPGLAIDPGGYRGRCLGCFEDRPLKFFIPIEAGIGKKPA